MPPQVEDMAATVIFGLEPSAMQSSAYVMELELQSWISCEQEGEL